jgi:hypothetical protein
VLGYWRSGVGIWPCVVFVALYTGRNSFGAEPLFFLTLTATGSRHCDTLDIATLSTLRHRVATGSRHIACRNVSPLSSVKVKNEKKINQVCKHSQQASCPVTNHRVSIHCKHSQQTSCHVTTHRVSSQPLSPLACKHSQTSLHVTSHNSHVSSG